MSPWNDPGDLIPEEETVLWIHFYSDSLSMEKDLYRGRVKGGGVFFRS